MATRTWKRPAAAWRLAPGFLLAIALCVAAPAGAAPNPAEAARIERLIAHIAAQTQIRFIRNGQAHESAAAADHLRVKMEKAGSRIENADQFIEYLASRSSMSGKAYKIRLADGAEVLAGDWLRVELRRIERKPD